MNKLDYDIGDFNDYGTLKPGILLLLVTVFLSRHIFYGPLSLLASRKGRGSSGANLDMSFLTVESPFELLLAVPALLVLYAMAKRTPAAGVAVRTIWANGKSLLLLGVLLQLGFMLMRVLGSNQPVETPVFAGALANLYALFFLLTSNRVKDVFSMFPGAKLPGEN